MLSPASLITNLTSLPSQLGERISGKGSRGPWAAVSGGKWTLLPTSPSHGLSSPVDDDDDDGNSPVREFGVLDQRHRGWDYWSVVRVLKRRTTTTGGLFTVLAVVMLVFAMVGLLRGHGLGRMSGAGSGGIPIDDGGVIPLGQSRMRDGREVFWWEQFEKLSGYWVGRKHIVDVSGDLGRDAQNAGNPDGNEDDIVRRVAGGVTTRSEPVLVDVAPSTHYTHKKCYIDEDRRITAPSVMAYEGMPQGFPRPLFGSARAIGIRDDICYDRINRFAPYGYGFKEEEGGLGIGYEGDIEGREKVKQINFGNVNWKQVQDTCIKKNGNSNRTAFIIRTWHGYEYNPYHLMMLRAMVNELSLGSGGKYEVHFLIHVQNDSIPIWASKEVYDQVLRESLPKEFAGMGTLWSVAQMKLIYPPPFPESLVNFSGDDIYKAYRSLHFPLQYFATNHPEFDFFWHWEMDMRVTGHYLELLEQLTKYADSRPRTHLWAESSKFFIPALYDPTDDRAAYDKYTQDIAANDHSPISGPLLPESSLLDFPFDTTTTPSTPTDFIAINPLFDPNNTLWAFHDDITGYPSRPSTRAALITASRLSRRLLLTMHHETFRNKHTMFPEMYPASIALHYGYTAISAPLPIYHERAWPPTHADAIFNNAPILNTSSPEAKANMNHDIPHGRFHGPTGSVFGPGEHVFRGASYYSNAWFSEDLWRRWLGVRDWLEIDERAGGRLCFPMMVLHPVKHDE